MRLFPSNAISKFVSLVSLAYFRARSFLELSGIQQIQHCPQTFPVICVSSPNNMASETMIKSCLPRMQRTWHIIAPVFRDVARIFKERSNCVTFMVITRLSRHFSNLLQVVPLKKVYKRGSRGHRRIPSPLPYLRPWYRSLKVIMRRIFRKKTLPRSLFLDASFNSRNERLAPLISRPFIKSLRLDHTEMTTSSCR